ncbi:MAG: putative PEP-binding protein [Methylovirgula sp.]
MPAHSSASTSRKACLRAILSPRSISKASANWLRSRSNAGRKTRPDIKLGICGEHGGDPASIGFFERAGLDYVSCSPFRVPIARLAAAQAALGGLRSGEDS